MMGTNCADNGPSREALATFFEKSLAGTDFSSDDIKGYEFMADYRVHFELNDGRTFKIPYFSLPAQELQNVIAESCKTCFDYSNGLADLTIGYMALPYQGGSMRAHPTCVTIRNETGEEMWRAVEETMEVGREGEHMVDERDMLRPAFVKTTLDQDEQARITFEQSKERQQQGGEPPAPAQTMPDFVANTLAEVMTSIGPRGLAFARYSVDYHVLRNVLNAKRSRRRIQIPDSAAAIAREYNIK